MKKKKIEDHNNPLKLGEKIIKVSKETECDFELDFGPYWGYLIIPKNSKINKKLNLKVGDKIKVGFKKCQTKNTV